MEFLLNFLTIRRKPETETEEHMVTVVAYTLFATLSVNQLKKINYTL